MFYLHSVLSWRFQFNDINEVNIKNTTSALLETPFRPHWKILDLGGSGIVYASLFPQRNATSMPVMNFNTDLRLQIVSGKLEG
jgi:hypothetical protein